MKTLLEKSLIMCIRQNLAVSLVLAISMVGVSYGAGGDLPGDGSSESTAYLIEDLADFDVFADPCNSATYWASGVYTKLVYDIDLTGKSYTTAVIAPDGSSYFGGVFNGDSHIVSNMTIDTMSANNNYLGLFGKISGSSAEIKNIGIENININGGTGSRFLGGLCGWNDYGTITDCHAAGVVTGNDYLGGLCGYNYYGTIIDCYATGSVTGYSYLGGLCGFNYRGTIIDCYAVNPVTGGNNSNRLGGLCGNNHGGTVTNCYATGAVTGEDDSGGLGGLCGNNGYNSTITNCYATGAVTGGIDSYYLGGLCGQNNWGTITNCYTTGAVTGGDSSDYLGGLCGENDDTINNCYATGAVTGGDYSNYLGGLCGENDDAISNCYATGAVTGENYLGGLCGYHRGTINNCYATGSVISETGSYYVGGFCGTNYDTITHCFWDVNAGGPDNGIGTPKTTEEMQTQSTFTNEGWDFMGEDVNGTDDFWRMCVDGIDYPKLSWQFLAGDFVCPGGVDLIDFAILSNAWLSDDTSTANWNEGCDLDGSGVIDIGDLKIFAEYWLCD